MTTNVLGEHIAAVPYGEHGHGTPNAQTVTLTAERIRMLVDLAGEVSANETLHTMVNTAIDAAFATDYPKAYKVVVEWKGNNEDTTTYDSLDEAVAYVKSRDYLKDPMAATPAAQRQAMATNFNRFVRCNVYRRDVLVDVEERFHMPDMDAIVAHVAKGNR